MKILQLFLSTFIIASLAQCSFAEDSVVKKIDISGNQRTGYVIPTVSNNNPDAMKAEIDKQNYLAGSDENMVNQQASGNEKGQASDGIKEVAYDEYGSIANLTLDDGTIVKYERNAEGELTIESARDGVALKFKDNGRENSQKNKTYELTAASGPGPSAYNSYSRDPDNTNEERPIIVIVYVKETPGAENSGEPGDGTAGQSKPALQVICPNSPMSVAKLAKTPMKFDFKEIKKAIEKTSELRARALKEYRDNTSAYYNAVDAAIKKNVSALEKDGVDLKEFKGRIADAKKRSVIDTVIEDIYVRAKEGEADKAVAELFSLEKGFRSRIINPEKEVYESRLGKAVEYTNEMVEKLINSQLALYLNIKKDRIDVIINLQKIPKPNK